jgi:hypothetical protein
LLYKENEEEEEDDYDDDDERLLLVVQIMQKDLLLHQLQSKIQGISGLSLCFSFSTIR